MQRFRLNAPGDFYVVDGQCITCMAPHGVAPELMGFHAAPAGGSHCYFARQPRNTTEVEAAVAAVTHSCCEALRYAGSDPDVLERLVEKGASDACDILAEKPRRSSP